MLTLIALIAVGVVVIAATGFFWWLSVMAPPSGQHMTNQVFAVREALYPLVTNHPILQRIIYSGVFARDALVVNCTREEGKLTVVFRTGTGRRVTVTISPSSGNRPPKPSQSISAILSEYGTRWPWSERPGLDRSVRQLIFDMDDEGFRIVYAGGNSSLSGLGGIGWEGHQFVKEEGVQKVTDVEVKFENR